MAKRIIPHDFIDNLLEQLNIADVVAQKINLKKNGANSYLGLCPFHNEKTPSFTVNTAKNFYHCFGCGAGGNALKFIMEYDRLDFVSSVEYLATFAGLKVPYEQNNDDLDKKIALNKTLYTVLLDAQNIYCAQLKQHPQREIAVNYLKNRGFSGVIAKQFALGFAPPNQWDLLLKQLSTKYDKQTLQLAGLINESDKNGKFYDKFRGRIMFPIRDKRGRVTGFGGRTITDDKPKYLNSPETAVFHKSQQLYGLYEMHQTRKKPQEIIVVEGYLDVISLAGRGIYNVVATLGTAISDSQINLLLRECNKIIFCFDGDDAGRKAADNAVKIALPLLQDGKQIKLVFLPQGSDPDSFINQHGQEKLQEYIAKQAVMLSDYLFNQLLSGLNSNSIEDKAQLQKNANALIKQIKAPNLRMLMAQRLHSITGIGKNTAPKHNIPNHNTNNNSHELNRLIKNYSINCERALKILALKPQLANQIDLTSIEVFNPLNQFLFDVVSMMHQNNNLSTSKLLAELRESAYFSILYEIPQTQVLGENLDADADFVAELNGAINNLIKLKKKIKRKLPANLTTNEF